MNFCKFMDSCMYDHKKIDQNRSLMAKIDDITKKYDEVMKKGRTIEARQGRKLPDCRARIPGWCIHPKGEWQESDISVLFN